MKERIRRLPKDRKEELLAAALKLAEKQGYKNVSRMAIADACGVSEALLSHHFGTMVEFRRTLMRYAVKEGNATLVMQGLADGNPYARKAPEALRLAAITQMTA